MIPSEMKDTADRKRFASFTGNTYRLKYPPYWFVRLRNDDHYFKFSPGVVTSVTTNFGNGKFSEFEGNFANGIKLSVTFE